MQREMKSKRKALHSKRRRRVKPIIPMFLLSLFIVAILVIIKTIFCPKIEEIYDDHYGLVRNIAPIVFMLDNYPADRNIAWNSEKPKFVLDDMEYCDKVGIDNITYQFKEVSIKISKDNTNEWYVFIGDDPWGIYDELKDFSFYKDNANNLIVYGYSLDLDNWFYQWVIDGKEVVENNILTIDANIPFDEVDKQHNSMKIGEYTLSVDSNTFYFYKDGLIVSFKKFTEESIDTIYLDTGLFLTESNKLYMIFAYLDKDRMPTVSFEFVADGISNEQLNLYSLRLKDKSLYWPCFKINDVYYTLSVGDWSILKEFWLQSDNLYAEKNYMDMSAEIIPLVDHFKSAKFSYEYETWKAIITFEIKGQYFETLYYFGGYDSNVELPEEVYSEYSIKTAKSIDELWSTIESIRKLYNKFYDHQGDFSPLFIYATIIL